MPLDMNFELDLIYKSPVNIAMIGTTGCGKTTLLRYILCNKAMKGDQWKHIFLFSGMKESPRDNKLEYFIMDNHRIHIEAETTKNILADFKKWVEEIGEQDKKNDIPNLPKTLFIFDDIGKSTKGAFNNFTNVSRHNNVWTIFLVHRFEDLDPDVRSSCKIQMYLSPQPETTKVGKIVKNKLPNITVIIDDSQLNPGDNTFVLEKEVVRANAVLTDITHYQEGVDKDLFEDIMVDPTSVFRDPGDFKMEIDTFDRMLAPKS